MKINIKATKVELSEELKTYIQRKMDMLDKYLGSVQALNCDVEVGQAIGSHQAGKIHRCEVNLEVPGELLRVEKMESDLHKAIDKVKDHLAQAITKYKGKKLDKKRKREEVA